MIVLLEGYLILVGLKLRDLDLIEGLTTSSGTGVGILITISVALSLTGSVVKDSNHKRLKVVLVHNSAMWYRLPFFKALAQLYDLVIFFTDTSSVEGLQGVKYEVLKRPLKGSRKISFLQADVFVPRLIFRLMVRDYDVVVGGMFDIATFFVAKIRRKPFILWSETWHFSERQSFTFRLVKPVFRFLISHSDAILVPSQMFKKEIMSSGAPEKRRLSCQMSATSASPHQITARLKS